MDWKTMAAIAVALVGTYTLGVLDARWRWGGGRLKRPILSITHRDIDILRFLERCGHDGSYGLVVAQSLKLGMWRTGSVYPLLRNLEEQALLESWEETPGPDQGRLLPRRRYRLSLCGKSILGAICGGLDPVREKARGAWDDWTEEDRATEREAARSLAPKGPTMMITYDIASYIDRAISELQKTTITKIQIETALTWCGRACAAAVLGQHDDAVKYADEAVEHAALSGNDQLLATVRMALKNHKIAP
jgi:DNA-binding PadR family transcriptional regulator